MRVVSGSAKGKILKSVSGKSTRPTSDKVKEALFSMIGPYFNGGTVLDLYAGTGALGIEALSRGMEKGIFVDREKRSVDVIAENLLNTRLSEQAEVYRNDAERALKALVKREIAFDLVLLDPPYKLRHMDKLLHAMLADGMIAEDGIAVVEHDAAHRYGDQIGSLRLSKFSVYGDTAVAVYINERNETLP